MDVGILSILPPIIAVTMALITQNVYISLLAGLFIGNLIIVNFSILLGVDGVIDSVIGIFGKGGSVTTMLAIALLGGLIHLIQQSGGVNGFVDFLTAKTSLINTKKKANFFTWVLGVVVFVSANMSSLIAGSITRPVNDKLKTSHEKLAFIVHTGSAPVCVLIPLSSWGAYMITTLENSGVENAAGVMLQSIPLSFYVIIAVFAVPFMILLGLDFGPMKKAELRAENEGLLDPIGKSTSLESSNEDLKITDRISSSFILILPIITMILVTIMGMYFTGGGNILEGAGMRSFLWGVLSAITLAMLMIKQKKILSFSEMSTYLYQGISNMIPVVIILVFALALGAIIKELGTGIYLANTFSNMLVPAFLPAIVFVFSMIIAFSTGSSWGTWAVMIPLSMPLAMSMGVSIPLLAGAVWSGGIFGDQSSPLSDTSVITSAATGCGVVDHIKTQIPYTLTFAGISFVLFTIFGFIL